MELFDKEDIYDFFLSQLKKYSRMIEFMRNECILLTRTKVANRDSRISSLRKVLNIVSTNDENERIRGIASLMLIVQHFQEDMTLLFQVVDGTTSDEELETKFGTISTPLLIVKRESLFDENGEFFIIIDGQVCIEAVSLTRYILPLHQLLCLQPEISRSVGENVGISAEGCIRYQS
ncbi:uncharacterized protein LOC107037545 [Diachasma alloeum]|uniref:uncharacterized protein LOC107037545 n=1 Tax=Diachasma alloeum TaxID=454923 RepID=UPI0007381A2D|nr:uncharacterized protein LOC107037545 [Diachasma alloeum]